MRALIGGQVNEKASSGNVITEFPEERSNRGDRVRRPYERATALRHGKKYKLTRNPFSHVFGHIGRMDGTVDHLQERLSCLLRTVQCIWFRRDAAES